MDKISPGAIKYPAILKQQFNLPNPGDTYINMKNYGKGYVWVNGRNLGRYWHRGPQFRLYCPGVWLKKENNEIVILELLSAEEEGITGEHELVEIKKQ
jgi:beta-galactosidase